MPGLKREKQGWSPEDMVFTSTEGTLARPTACHNIDFFLASSREYLFQRPDFCTVAKGQLQLLSSIIFLHILPFNKNVCTAK